MKPEMQRIPDAPREKGKASGRRKPRRPFWSFRRSLTLFLFLILMADGLITFGICRLAWLILERLGIRLNTNDLPWYAALIIVFVLLLGTFLSSVLSRIWLKTTHDLAEAADAVSRGDFSRRVSERGHRGEFGNLIRSFNHMTEELANTELFRCDFINYFSHEFKTPIVSIRGFARELEDPALTDGERRDIIRIITSECDRLVSLSAHILELTKLENQRILTDTKPVEVDEQIRRVFAMLEPDWNRAGLIPELEMDPVTIVGNEEMLASLWINLIGNAIKFSLPGGRIEVVTDDDGSAVHVVISDEGIGMDEKTKAHVFDKFYQGDTSHRAEGNGIGLATVKRIVELHGGSISVTSRPNEGSSFALVFPKQDVRDRT